MTGETPIRLFEATRRSFIRYGAFLASAITLGAGATGAAGVQPDDDAEGTVVLFGDEYRPGVDFAAVSVLDDETTRALFEATDLTSEFDDPDEWDVYLGTFDVGGSAPVLGHLLTRNVDLEVGTTLGTTASYRNAELNLVETSLDGDGDGVNDLSGPEHLAVE